MIESFKASSRGLIGQLDSCLKALDEIIALTEAPPVHNQVNKIQESLQKISAVVVDASEKLPTKMKSNAGKNNGIKQYCFNFLDFLGSSFDPHLKNLVKSSMRSVEQIEKKLPSFYKEYVKNVQDSLEAVDKTLNTLQDYFRESMKGLGINISSSKYYTNNEIETSYDKQAAELARDESQKAFSLALDKKLELASKTEISKLWLANPKTFYKDYFIYLIPKGNYDLVREVFTFLDTESIDNQMAEKISTNLIVDESTDARKKIISSVDNLRDLVIATSYYIKDTVDMKGDDGSIIDTVYDLGEQFCKLATTITPNTPSLDQ